jgi:hypothetical protein
MRPVTSIMLMIVMAVTVISQSWCLCGCGSAAAADVGRTTSNPCPYCVNESAAPEVPSHERQSCRCDHGAQRIELISNSYVVRVPQFDSALAGLVPVALATVLPSAPRAVICTEGDLSPPGVPRSLPILLGHLLL